MAIWRDLSLEEAESIRVGDHEHGRLLVESRFQLVEIDQPGLAHLELHALEAGQGGTRGIGAVALAGKSTRVRCSPLIAEISGRHQQGRQFALSSGRRLQRDGRQA